MGKISLVLPVYNEQIILRDVLHKYIADLENIRIKKKFDWEIIAVDDDSTDESKLILIEFARQYRNFKVVTLTKRSGKHIAVTAGLAVTSGNIVMTAEIDLQNPMGLLEQMLQQHLDSGAPIIYGYQQFSGWRKRRAFITDRLTRFACRLFMLDGYFTGIVNAELYAADVVDVLRSDPAKTKYMRAMNNWVGWETKEYWYAREYTDAEEKTKLEQLRRRQRNYRSYKKSGHVKAINNWYGVLCLFLAAITFGIGFAVTNKVVPIVLGIIFTAGFGLVVAAIMFFLRALLMARIGKVTYVPGEIIYEIKSILNK